MERALVADWGRNRLMESKDSADSQWFGLVFPEMVTSIDGAASIYVQ